MQAIMSNTRGLSVLMGVARDRMLGLAAVAAALLAGAWLSSLGLN